MSGTYHEPVSELDVGTREIHRALCSLMEELEAIDWYQQRADATPSEDLKAILIHNRDEEMEHAAMALEWLRRRMPRFDEKLRTYLFTTDPITEIEEGDEAEQGSTGKPARGGDLGIGKFEKSA